MSNYKSIGYIINIINRYSNIYFMDAMQDLNLHGPGQIRIVLTLSRYKKGITQEELAASMYVDKASISRMIRPLVGNGIVKRETNPDDHRAYILSLTDKVRKRVPEIRERALEWTDILTKGLPSEEIVQLSSCLEKLEANAHNYIKGYNNE